MEISCRELCHKGLGVDSCDREKEGSLAYRVEAGFDATTLSLLDDIEGILADMDDACNDSRTPPPMSVLPPRLLSRRTCLLVLQTSK
jgi:hypothetical protein